MRMYICDKCRRGTNDEGKLVIFKVQGTENLEDKYKYDGTETYYERPKTYFEFCPDCALKAVEMLMEVEK